ncbi:MAG: HTH-type transcriptional regulator CysB [Betaproteobacteria bacterium]|nr:HTH-type transcriptional regulator CysB [Betaproteobacteria bacterium]MBL8535656.1 HTH-type transcriptional regulator CysB [Betaproteobacteria bacterium]
MKLQQFRTIVEVSRQGLNLSKAAQTLYTSQPALSKQILQLEEELGVTIFVRSGKRFVGITPPGQEVLAIAERILLEARSLKDVSAEFHRETTGSFTVATTHTQARYALPPVVRQFMKRYPQVRLSLKQGSPTQIAEQVIHGQADIAIATEALDMYGQLAMLPCYQWNRCIVVPPKHPLLEMKRVSLEAIARFPIITYDFAFTGRSTMQRAFESKGLKADIVLTAIDADVIKTYVELELGIGIIAEMAFDPKRDRHLRAIDASHLFEPNTTRIGIRRGTYLRGFAYDFIEMFAPHLTRDAVDTAMSTPAPATT